MTVTRSSSESMALARGVRAVLAEVAGEDAISAPSPNATLGPIVGSALMLCGITPDDPTSPTDAECGRVAAAQLPRYWNALEYFALLTAWTGYGLTQGASTVSLGSVTVSSGGSAKQLESRVASLAKMLGIGGPRTAGLAVGNLPPPLARPLVPQSQNWPPAGPGGRYGWRRGW